MGFFDLWHSRCLSRLSEQSLWAFKTLPDSTNLPRIVVASVMLKNPFSCVRKPPFSTKTHRHMMPTWLKHMPDRKYVLKGPSERVLSLYLSDLCVADHSLHTKVTALPYALKAITTGFENLVCKRQRGPAVTCQCNHTAYFMALPLKIRLAGPI